MRYLSIAFFLLLWLPFVWADSLEELPRISGPDLKRNDAFYELLKQPPPVSPFPSTKESAPPIIKKQAKNTTPPFRSHGTAFRESFSVKKKERDPELKVELPKPSPRKFEAPVIFKKKKRARENKNFEKAKSSTRPPIIDRPKNTLSSKSRASILGSENSRHTKMPSYYQGLYFTARTANRSARYERLMKEGRQRGMNVLVVDVQPNFPKERFFQRARADQFYLVSRIVVFEGGLKRYPPSRRHLEKIYALVEKSAKGGFDEVQLDYIRFADKRRFRGLSLQKRYACIEAILKEVKHRLRPHGIPYGADLFGRISFNRNDQIGQKLELFAAHADTIYPMLYPSHFYGMPNRIKNPYRTVKEGIQNSMRRVRKVKENTRVIAYIQAFRMKIAPTGLSFVNYIYKQLQATAEAGASGYIAWNARNQYGHFFKALDKMNRSPSLYSQNTAPYQKKSSMYHKDRGELRLRNRKLQGD